MRGLFFALSAARTGSEIALYNFICHADRSAIDMGVACRYDGDLLKDLPSDVAKFVYGHDSSAAQILTDIAYIKWRGTLDEDRLIAKIHKRYKPDFWYINTIAQPGVLRQARRNNIPCVLHVHEMETVYQTLKEQDVNNIIEYPRLVMACSQAAADVLQVLGRKQVEVCQATIEIADIKSDAGRTKAIRNALGAGDDTFLWTMAGTLDANKNPGLFVEVASKILQERQNARFMWLGGTNNGYGIFAQRKAESLGIADKIFWIAARSHDYYDYLNAADAFVMTSARESLGLVMVEAAALGKPIVSFDTGGAKEIILDGMGTMVDSWNVGGLVSAMLKTMDGEVEFDPQVAKARAAQFTTSAHVNRWQELLLQSC